MGFDFQDGSIFFTLNGQFLGDAFEHARHRPTVGAEGALHAAVALHEPGDSARFNLGQQRFAFDIGALALRTCGGILRVWRYITLVEVYKARP